MGLCLYFSLTCNNERWKKYSASFKDSSVSSLTLLSPIAEVMIILGLPFYSDVLWVEHTFGTRIDRQQGCVISAGHTTTHSRDARALCRVTFPTHTRTLNPSSMHPYQNQPPTHILGMMLQQHQEPKIRWQKVLSALISICICEFREVLCL